ncbi:hypothetical protein LCGC14_1982170 [marine sediment metagenome]|uniref:Uncharacterized protein n=1 Tax=marine sediment metagenome TaxID=412755 RepID=A0A0F9HLT5_9ZZZZ
MSLTIYKSKTGETRMRPWNILVEATIQEVKFQGTITCHANNEESARKLARMSFINQLRGAGIWTHSDEINEPYEVEVEGPKDKKTGKPTKKKEIKHKKVTRYHAPTWTHVKVLDIIDLNSRDFTFPQEELEEAALIASGGISLKSRRRSIGEVAIAKRKKKVQSIDKKEKQQEKQSRAEANKQSKEELLQVVEAYFVSENAKVIKIAAGELDQTYQRVRYALFQIKDKGYKGAKYDLIQTEIDGSKAFRLEKKG